MADSSNSRADAQKNGEAPKGSAFTSFGSNLVKNLKNATGLGGAIDRLKGLNKDATTQTKSRPRQNFLDNAGKSFLRDPRIKIIIPDDYLKGPAQHLKDSEDNAVVFPYTPQIVVQTRANYNTVQPTHSNYAFYAYQNSMLDAISIVGTFSAQNINEARYMLGSIHALRAVTKMNFGASKNAGAPPPVCRLDGYGTYQFNRMPVVISSFFYTLNEDVDYLDVDDGANGFGDISKVPTRAEFTIECLPAFSRRDQAEFTIDKFADGDMTIDKGMV